MLFCTAIILTENGQTQNTKLMSGDCLTDLVTKTMSYNQHILWFALVVSGGGILALATIVAAIVPCLSLVVQALLVHALVCKQGQTSKHIELP